MSEQEVVARGADVVVTLLLLFCVSGVLLSIGWGAYRKRTRVRSTATPDSSALPSAQQSGPASPPPLPRPAIAPPAQAASGPAPAARWLTVDELAQADNVLIVGNRGSGKTTLMEAIVSRRDRAGYVFDPHASPEKWPAHLNVVGAGRQFGAIYATMLAAEAELTARARQMMSERNPSFAPFTLIGDEWGSISSEVKITKDQDTPGQILLRLLKEGRKFKISFIASAHGDTAASLGSKGDTEAFNNSFDWFVYCGAFGMTRLRELGISPADVPMGQTPEGGTFPLIVVAVSPTTGESRLLDLGLVRSVQPVRRPLTDPIGVTNAATTLQAWELPFPASGRDVTSGNDVPVTIVSAQEAAFIAMKLTTGMTPSNVVKELPGYSPRSYQTHRAKVDAVVAMLKEQEESVHG